MNKLFRITTVPISVEKLLGNQLTFMNDFFEVTAISADEENLKKAGEKLGVKTHSIEMTRQITPIKDLKSLWQMYCYFRKEKPTIVHTHTPKAGLIGMMAAKMAGVKIRMHTVAGLPLMEASGFKRKILNIVEKITYFCATKVYPNSFGLQEFILNEKFCHSAKLKVIGNGSTNGINIDFFSQDSVSEQDKLLLRKELNISDSDFVFVFVGRLVKDKGIQELVSAFHKLSVREKNIKLLLVGPFEQELDPLDKDTLSEINNNSNIISVGYQKDVRPYFSISNALVFPSYREGFPNVVLQSLAMQLPVIVSDINGCNEIVENNLNGIIVPPKNSTAIYQAMSDYLNPIFYNQIKSEARQSILKYEQHTLWQSILKEYQSFM